MIVYVRRQQIQECLRDLDSSGEAFHYRKIVVCDFDNHDVLHVHIEPPNGRMAGSPGYGLLVSVRLQTGITLESISEPERLKLVEAALKQVPYGEPDFLIVICARSPDPTTPAVRAFWITPHDNSVHECDTNFIPDQDEVFARTRGILETNLVANKTVAIIGLGSGGSICAVELVKCGVGKFHLMDFDRLELHNVARHCCGISDLGRYKTRAVRDLLLDKNPHCQVNTYEDNALEKRDVLETIIADSDVVIAGTDNNLSRRAINRACLRHKKVCLFGRMMLRACGGDVLRFRPEQGPCYECIMEAVWKNKQEEISQPAQAAEAAYVPLGSGRIVMPEPGLSNDIYPVATLIVKLAIQELVRGTRSLLQTLDDDLTSSFYIWANRRDEQYVNWPPMQYSIDGLTILRWYGVHIEQNPKCPICGQSEIGTNVNSEDEAFFSGQ